MLGKRTGLGDQRNERSRGRGAPQADTFAYRLYQQCEEKTPNAGFLDAVDGP